MATMIAKQKRVATVGIIVITLGKNRTIADYQALKGPFAQYKQTKSQADTAYGLRVRVEIHMTHDIEEDGPEAKWLYAQYPLIHGWYWDGICERCHCRSFRDCNCEPAPPPYYD